MAASNSQYLVMVFEMTDNSNLTLKISDPADGLTAGTVEAAGASFVANNVFKRNEATASALKESYIQTTTITELPEE